TYLSAIFPEFSGCGYGTVARCLDIKIAEELGAVTLETTFSSNNPAVASIFMKLGYRLKATSYIFVKHCWGTVDGSGQKR
ncbi:MAG: GNAT family N-acetyltransferase, partial [Coriobacteriales bacterium]|nr:GNAT family N-acetyltransferase [Coriobacteriales bacterium]